MILTSDTIESLIGAMVSRYRDLLKMDPEFLLLDEDSYETLKEEVLGKQKVFQTELDFYMGMRVFHSDTRIKYIRVV